MLIKKRPIRRSPTARLNGARRSILLSFLAATLALSALAGCGEEPQPEAPTPHDFELTVSAEDSDGNAVVKAPVLLDEQLIGHTDKDGFYRATVTDLAGTQITLGIGKMSGYLVPDSATTQTTLNRVHTIDGFSNTPVQLRAVLESARHDYLVWLKVKCAAEVADKHCQDMPVLKDGEEIARTDKDGHAHFELKGVPDETIELGLKTPTNPTDDDSKSAEVFDIKPENPTFSVTLGHSAEVLVLEQTFSDPIAAERIAKAQKDRAAANRRAAARRARAAQKRKAQEEKDKGVIDLW